MQVEIDADRLYNAGRDGLHLLNVSSDQGMLTDEIDKPWNPLRVVVDKLHRIGRQHQLSCASDAEPFGDVRFGFLAVQRARSAPHGNALTELAHTGVAQLIFEFRLTGKHNLQQFLRRGLQIGQQTNLFEQFP